MTRAETPTEHASTSTAVIRDALAAAELSWQEPEPDVFAVTLPGERKLVTSCFLRVGAHALGIHAFVARRPDENVEAVYRYLLEHNVRMYAVGFGIDHNGDIHLTGKLPLQSITGTEIDRVLGSVLEYADSTFNTILELGFASAIRREWAWRQARGESTRNLDAFRHLIDES